MLNAQSSKDLARDNFDSFNGDYTYLLKILLNEPSLHTDGNFSTINSPLNQHELLLIEKFFKLTETPNMDDFQIFGRIRLKNNLYYADALNKSKFKRQSSVCKWKFNNHEFYGIIHKFVKFKEKNIFIASKFRGKTDVADFYEFSDSYKTIFKLNNFGNYFCIFNEFKYDVNNLIICTSDSIVSTCVVTYLYDTKQQMVSPLIGFEHD